MAEPLVSITLTVYNGERFLSSALDSILAQDYNNFELIILDNLSTDRTREICLKYAQRDKRIRYILDEKLRNANDGANHIASFATGKYYMLVCDDDRWESSYITKLVSILESNSDIGLIYSGGYFMNIRGENIRRMCSATEKLLLRANSKFLNFCSYLILRNVIPILFGIYRTEVLRKTLPFVTFDASVADSDNLFVLKLLASTNVFLVDEPLFYYRIYIGHERWIDPKYGVHVENISKLHSGINAFKHELKLSLEILKIVKKSDFNFFAKLFLGLFIFAVSFICFFVKPFFRYMKKILVSYGKR